MEAEKLKEFDGIFNPKAVAIIGATQTDDFTNAMMRTKIKDNLFLVNPSRKEIHGKRCYDSILDIENTIDYVVLAVPAKVLPKVLNECIDKGVNTAHAFTAGFSETGIEERIELENEVKEIIKGKIRLIGPNCMGIYCPKSGLSFSPNAPSEEGTVGVISQSGTFAGLFSTWGNIRNLRVSKAVSFGNAIDLDCPDLLEYFAMAEASRKKPVIVLKGGVTEHGSRAASSHTGSLAGSPEIWSALFRQTGVIQVETFDDLVNAVLAVTRSPLPSGKGVSMITSTGGFSVIETDVCLKVGLEVPQFEEETLKELRRMVPAAGTAIRNPLDAWPLYYNISEKSETIDDAIKIVASDKNIHSLLLHFDEVSYFMSVFGDALGDHLKGLIKLMLDGCEYARNELGKPVVVCVELDPYSEDEADRMYHLMVKNAFEEKQYPVYPTLEASIKAMFNLYRHGMRLNNE
jgi:acetyltransferase